MKQSILTIVSEYQKVLSTRKRLEKMFSKIAECHVTVGGSYMLKYWCEAFSDREVSDYDFILYALPENIEKIEVFISLLNYQTGWIGTNKYYDYKSFYLGTCNTKRVNVILKPVEKYCPCANFESLEDIIAVKKSWINKAISRNKKPRQKDLDDVSTYMDWQKDHDLPF